jgi:hypothetical protein
MSAIGGYVRFCILNRAPEKLPISCAISGFSQNAKRPVRFKLAKNPRFILLLLNDRETVCDEAAYVALNLTIPPSHAAGTEKKIHGKARTRLRCPARENLHIPPLTTTILQTREITGMKLCGVSERARMAVYVDPPPKPIIAYISAVRKKAPDTIAIPHIPQEKDFV